MLSSQPAVHWHGIMKNFGYSGAVLDGTLLNVYSGTGALGYGTWCGRESILESQRARVPWV